MYKNKGDLFERSLSKCLHTKFTPVLISSKFLRQFQCGQIDIAYISQGELVLAEIKSSSIGVESMAKTQSRRLQRSVALLYSLLEYPVKFKIIAKRR